MTDKIVYPKGHKKLKGGRTGRVVYPKGHGKKIPSKPRNLWPPKDLEAYKTMSIMELVKAREGLVKECWQGRPGLDWTAEAAIDAELERRDKLLEDLK